MLYVGGIECQYERDIGEDVNQHTNVCCIVLLYYEERGLLHTAHMIIAEYYDDVLSNAMMASDYMI